MGLEDFSGKTVLITGSCGTVGAELCRQLLAGPVGHVICLDNNETDLFFQQERYKPDGRVKCYLPAIRDLEALKLRISCCTPPR